jgi:hypothetical protein
MLFSNSVIIIKLFYGCNSINKQRRKKEAYRTISIYNQCLQAYKHMRIIKYEREISFFAPCFLGFFKSCFSLLDKINRARMS